MVDFHPFRGIRYDPSVAGAMQELICPPYDVISSGEEQTLLAHSPNNMVRLELAEVVGQLPTERYSDASAAFKRMLDSGVLRRDESPAYYVMRQRFPAHGGSLERLSICGALRIEELGKGVLPHEDTAPGPKEDRLALMGATEANFSPLMMLYRDPRGVVGVEVAKAVEEPPLADFSVDGDDYTLWSIAGPAGTSAIMEALSGQPVYIADGHHRYETSLAYRDARERAQGTGQNSAHRFVMTCLINFDDPGLLIQPYYRVVHGLGEDKLRQLKDLMSGLFVSSPAGVPTADPDKLDAVVAMNARGTVALGLVERGKEPMLLTPTIESIPDYDASASPEEQARTVEALVLQEMLFRPLMGAAFPNHVAYVHEGQEAVDMVERGDGQMAFFVKGVPADVFESVVGAGIRLPRKSTYFHPKLPSGLVINSLAGEL